MTGPDRRAAGNNANFLPSRGQLLVKVTLDCGHTVSMRLAPINKQARYGCSMGQGCGYSLRWTKYLQGEQVTFNRDNPPKEPTEEKREAI